MKFEAQLESETIPVDVTGGAGRFTIVMGGERWEVDGRQVAEGIWSLLVGGVSHVVDVTDQDGVCVVEVDGESYRMRIEEETRYIIRTRGARTGTSGQVLKAPMPGKVVHIEVAVGQAVKSGDGLIVLEAMKMENEFRATAAGTVKEVPVEVGQAVNPGDVLVVIE